MRSERDVQTRADYQTTVSPSHAGSLKDLDCSLPPTKEKRRRSTETGNGAVLFLGPIELRWPRPVLLQTATDIHGVCVCACVRVCVHTLMFAWKLNAGGHGMGPATVTFSSVGELGMGCGKDWEGL